MRKYNSRNLSSDKKDKILEDFNYTCAYCYGPAIGVDHIIPWNYKHINDISNLVACCQICNSIAGDMVFKGFYEKQNYILLMRNKMENRPVCIWLENEITLLKGNLKKFIKEVTICADCEEHRQKIKKLLLDSGYSVNIDGEIFKPKP